MKFIKMSLRKIIIVLWKIKPISYTLFMTNNTLQKIEHIVANAKRLPSEKREGLLDLITKLKAELEENSSPDLEEKDSIVGFTERSVHEALRENKNDELADLSMTGLKKSILKFEASHPDLVSIINKICVSLSNLGI
jgi:hypothetical protein